MEIHENNRFYWSYRDSPILPIGATDTDHLFQWEDDRLEEHLDELVEVGGNYVRNTMSDRDEECLKPFKQVNGMYDLNKWNQEYWRRLENFLEQTKERDIIVQIELWDGHDMKGELWQKSPYNPEMNVNYDASEIQVDQDLSLGDPFWHTHPFYLAPPTLNNYPQLLKYQKKFIRKIIEVSSEYDHVLYTICNECSMPQQFSNYWAKFIKEEADSKGEKIFVSDMRINGTTLPILEYSDLYDFSDISQIGTFAGQHHYELILGNRKRLKDNPSPMNVVKQYGSDEDKVPMTVSEDEAVKRFWRCIMGGCASFRFHRPKNFGIGLNERAKNMIKSLRKLQDEFNFFHSSPKEEVFKESKVDEAYALTTQEKILIYFTNGGEITLDSEESKSTLKWLDIESSKWTESEKLTDGRVKCPEKGQWAAILSE